MPGGIPNDTFSVKMIGNTLLKWGTEEQKRHFLPRILSGDDVWCQGYSEPDAGSDLARLSTRAVLDGDEWVLDGQKIWTSNAHLANWIFVLARTDPTAPRHKGITFLLVPLRQPGIEIRPIPMLSKAREFNETFFTGARTAAGNVVGAVNAGWGVAMTSARPRTRRGSRHQPGHVPQGTRPARSSSPASAAGSTTPSSANASPTATCGSRP